MRVDAWGQYHSPNICFLDPVSLAVVSIGSTVLSAGVGAIGAIQQGNAAAASANYQAQVAKNNQTIAEQNATYSRQAGQAETEAEGMKTASIVGAAVAGQGAAGVDPTTGSPADVVRGTRETRRLDTLNIVQNAELRARGFDIQGSNFGAQSHLDRLTASNAQTAGLYGAGASLLGGASSVATKWQKYQTEGIF
jgi:hypothetical protein